MATTDERVKKIIGEQLTLGPEEVTPQASFGKDLGCDSLDVVEIIMALEEEFDIGIEDAEAARVETIADSVALVERKLLAVKS
jgi:acyl carrier protein